MDKLVKYRTLIQELLASYASQEHLQPESDTEEQLIFDTVRDHYQLLAVGWERDRRVFFCVLHLDIKGDKIWLQENSTDYDIVADLVSKGVSSSDIVIGFHPKEVRALTEFAVA